MDTSTDCDKLYLQRLAFIERLSCEYIALTGYGVYVHLSPVDVDRLFYLYLSLGIPIKTFVRQRVTNALV